MNTSLTDNRSTEIFHSSNAGIEYTLISHILCSSDFPPCPSYTLIVKDDHETIVLDDLTIHFDRALQIAQCFFLEEILPENVPFIAEDLLADELFVC
jgi:hypothetical protein